MFRRFWCLRRRGPLIFRPVKDLTQFLFFLILAYLTGSRFLEVVDAVDQRLEAFGQVRENGYPFCRVRLGKVLVESLVKPFVRSFDRTAVPLDALGDRNCAADRVSRPPFSDQISRTCGVHQRFDIDYRHFYLGTVILKGRCRNSCCQDDPKDKCYEW